MSKIVRSFYVNPCEKDIFVQKRYNINGNPVYDMYLHHVPTPKEKEELKQYNIKYSPKDECLISIKTYCFEDFVKDCYWLFT